MRALFDHNVNLGAVCPIQDVKAAKRLMIGDEARRSGVIYLEYSSVEIQVKQGGRKWKVYGCPVCSNSLIW